MAIADDIALYALGRWMHESHPMRMEPLCLNNVQWKNLCTACTDACPEGVAVHGAQVSWGACTACNRCIAACPTSALNESRASFDAVAVALAGDSGHVTVACDRHDGPCDVRRGCIGLMPWDLLAGMALAKPLVLKLQHCFTCPHADLVERTKRVVRNVRRFLGRDSFERRVSMADPEGGSGAAGARKRQAFEHAARAVQNEAGDLVGPAGAAPVEGTAPEAPALSRHRALLLESIAAADSRDTFNWPVLSEDGACTACGACVAMCSHGALSLDLPGAGDPADAALVFDASLCTQCGLCYLSCPEQTIGGWDRAALPAGDATVRFPLEVRICEKCGDPFKPESDEARCRACSRFRFK